jgi:hypothetical protein
VNRLIVFSKDRPFQCESLLRSIRDWVIGIDDVVVVAQASFPRSQEAYELLRDITYGPAGWRLIFERGSCTQELDALLIDADFVGFAVDDQVFFRPSDYQLAARALVVEKAFLWSWRLSSNPGVTESRGDWWTCAGGAGPYGYLFHTDGSFYEKTALVTFLDRAIPTWRSARYTPNDLEGRAVRYARGLHVGPQKKTCVSFAVNKVTTAAGATTAWCASAETTVEALVDSFLIGKRLDNETLYTRADVWAAATHVAATQEAAKFYASLIR